MKKKLAVIILSVATVFSLSSSVFAANPTTNVGVKASKTVTMKFTDLKMPIPSTYYYNFNGWSGTLPMTSSTCSTATLYCSQVTYSGTVYQ